MSTTETLLLPDLEHAASLCALPQHERFARYNQALKAAVAQGKTYPVALLDLAAVRCNAADLVRRAEGVPIRIASKSLRVPSIISAILALDGFSGVLAYSLGEAIELVRSGVTDDAVVGYPVLDSAQLTVLHSDPELLQKITLMVDRPEQLTPILAARTMVASGIGSDAANELPATRICLDVDCSLRFSRLVHIGARRSAIRTVRDAVAAATHIAGVPGLKLVGIMGYEAQIAGVTDSSMIVRQMKRVSVRELSKRRTEIVRAVRKALAAQGAPDLEFVNGGGTGSFETTRAETEVTELAAGSGLFGPHLFDGYDAFKPQPAAFFATQVTRKPTPDIVTVHGGGWVASGAAGADRLPKPVWPRGLAVTDLEGAGEVQTPLRVRARAGATGTPEIGSPVWWRHTKAGELAEHVNEFWALGTDLENLHRLLTYRGEGAAFL
ncbi:alanine racemase [Canibacter zhoujuaniae]|uniref:alanine racemase n=1 Tax=Canibacter zhoujuaniae TaxID=2708343 RepID=UPI001422DB29|nr:alanine racemase [Canibacter zhoujuaniae]